MADEQGNEQGLSLRDALMSAVEQHREPPAEIENTPAEPAAPVPAATETPAQAAQRARDEAGRFAKTDTKPAVPAAPAAPATTTTAAAPLEPAAPRPAPPSSWRKEHQDAFAKLDPTLQNYIHERERQFATGVSTYKAEADRARSLQAAMEPFTPILQQYNIQPEQWITNLGNAHRVLATGSPHQRAQMFTQLARDYGIDLSQITGQPAQAGQQPGGALDPNTAWLQQELQKMRAQVDSFAQAQQRQQQEVVQQQQATIETMISEMAADTTNYPHFPVLREKMAGLLQSGLAQDLKSAYTQALRLDDGLWNSQQEAQRTQQDAEQKRLAAEQAAKARGKVVSVKSSTPAGQAAAAAPQGRRAQLQEAFASHSASRV
jgi:hypothetical protein